MQRRNKKITLMRQQGFTLLEIVIALAIIGIIIPLVLGGLSLTTQTTDRVYDRSVLFELAQSQLESIESQPYSVNASGYTLLSPPAGYSLLVTTSPAVTYTYAAPKSTSTNETVQLVTVTVTGVRGNMEVSRYRVRK